MRLTLLFLLVASSLCAQESEDRAIERGFERLMRTIEAPADEGEVSEEEARARAAQFRSRLDAFVTRWEARASRLTTGRFLLGKALAMAGQPGAAAEHFAAFVRAHEDAPEHGEARIAWGSARLDSGDAAGAAEVLAAFLGDPAESESARRPIAQYYLALARIELGAPEAALALLEQAIASGSETPIPADAALKKIEVLRDLGRIEEARAALKRLRDQNPDSPYLNLMAEQLRWHGRAAPELEAIAEWFFAEGEEQPIASRQGRVIVLNFFALHYPACRSELADLVELRQRFDAGNVAFLGVTKDYSKVEEVPIERQRARLKEGLRALGVSFPIAIAEDFRNLRAYEVRGIPHTVVIDGDGKVVHLKIGSSERDRWAERRLEEAIRKATQ